MSATDDTTDVVIVGAGVAGGAIAARLVENGVRVVLLEQGPFVHDIDHPIIRDDWVQPRSGVVVRPERPWTGPGLPDHRGRLPPVSLQRRRRQLESPTPASGTG